MYLRHPSFFFFLGGGRGGDQNKRGTVPVISGTFVPKAAWDISTTVHAFCHTTKDSKQGMWNLAPRWRRCSIGSTKEQTAPVPISPFPTMSVSRFSFSPRARYSQRRMGFFVVFFLGGFFTQKGWLMDHLDDEREWWINVWVFSVFTAFFGFILWSVFTVVFLWLIIVFSYRCFTVFPHLI